MPGLRKERFDNVEGHAIRDEQVLPILHEAREQMNGHIALRNWLRRRKAGERPRPSDMTEQAWFDVLNYLNDDQHPHTVAMMTWHCQNIDQDTQGWYATIYVSERGEHVCGRGPNIWAAVKEAHRLAANAEVS